MKLLPPSVVSSRYSNAFLSVLPNMLERLMDLYEFGY